MRTPGNDLAGKLEACEAALKAAPAFVRPQLRPLADLLRALVAEVESMKGAGRE